MAVAAVVVGQGRFPMRRVATAFGVSRSALQERAKRRAPRTRSRPQANDDALAERVTAVVTECPSYGYRFVTAMVNRIPGAGRVNAKRVYRVMRERGLLLRRHASQPTLRHDGKVTTLKSNLRWCSDGFEIRCWNAEKVFVTFSLDCCDREAIAFRASTAHPTGETVRDVMAETVESRFGAGVTETPNPVEWLSDNGPPYTATETREFGRTCGLLVVNTPAYSPESNGMAESFVRTFRRDFVSLNRLPDAATVLAALPAWFEHYNEVRPHSRLGMQSPRAFRRAQAAA